MNQEFPQEGLSGNQRRKNIIGSFGINEKYEHLLQNKRILLIDDVFTTGSTVNESAKVLKKHGTKEIFVLIIAKVVI